MNRPGEYRSDIDGLRAIAIIGVLLFHFGIGPVAGGFAGVDVFFVISGFLVTAMLLRQPVNLSNLARFYLRRFWRIAPAYFVTLAVTLLVGAVLLLPEDAERLGASALASAGFVSNFFFSTGFGYFDTSSIYKPLLHLWSLAVEMQFYLVWPAVMLGVQRLPRRWQMLAMCTLITASLLACQILSLADPKVAFFAIPARLWEFALGGIVALTGPARATGTWQRWQPVLANTSLAMIATAMLTLGESDLWPAPWAVPVAVATTVLLYLGAGDSLARRLLVAAPMRFIGRISYSLYLVHWPLAVFISYGQFPTAPIALRVMGLCASIVLAYGLHRIVEVPMRRLGFAGFRPLAPAMMVPLLLACAGYVVHLSPAWLSRWPDHARETAGQMAEFVCVPWQATPQSPSFCRIGDSDAAPSTLLWGDSHAMQFAPGFASAWNGSGKTFIIATKNACPPVTGLTRVSNSLVHSPACENANARAMQVALNTPSIHQVFLAARWALYGETTRYGDEKGARAFLVADRAADLSVTTTQNLLQTHLLAQVQQLVAAGKSVVLVAQVPEMGFDAGRCVAMHRAFGYAAISCDIDKTSVITRQAFVTRLLTEVATATGARLVDPKAQLCGDSICRAMLEDGAAYRDDNHLTSFAARSVVQQMVGQPDAHESQAPPKTTLATKAPSP